MRDGADGSRRSARESRRSSRIEPEEAEAPARRRSSRREERPSRRDGRDSGRSRRQSARSKRVDDDYDDSRESSRRSVRRSTGFMGLTQEQQIYAGAGAGALLLLIIGVVLFSGGSNDDEYLRRRRRRAQMDAVQGNEVIDNSPAPRKFISSRTPFSGDAYGEGASRGRSFIKVSRSRAQNPTADQIRFVAERMTADYNMTKEQEAKFVEGFLSAAGN